MAMANIIYKYIANRIRFGHPDSWVEVSSQPSSSSLSSAADDLLHEGSRIHHGSRLHARRRPRPGASLLQGNANPEFIAGSSSQEEYEESESESDRAMNSSTEGVPRSSLRYELQPKITKRYSSTSSENLLAPEVDLEHDDADRDEVEKVSDGATIIGSRPAEPCFTPQPNAFSHPTTTTPTIYVRQTSTSNHEMDRFASRPLPQRQTYSSQYAYRQQQHTPYNTSPPANQADHDAALRASLSTLLSCAAAARGLSKTRQNLPSRPSPPSRVTAESLRLVPESVVLGTAETTTVSPPENHHHEETNSRRQKSIDEMAIDSQSRCPSASQRLRESTKRKSSSNVATAASTGQTLFRRQSSNKEKDKDNRSFKRARRIAGTNLTTYNDNSASAESLLSSIYSTSTSTSSASAASIEHTITPTLLTWVLSAGVVVLVSALSFSAGFSAGRESTHAELLSSSAGSRGSGGTGWARFASGAFDGAVPDPVTAASCGRDAAWGRSFGLRRLRWTGAALGGAASVSV